MRDLLHALHRAIEKRTGLVFGFYRSTGYTTSGYPIRHLWLAIAPRRDGYAFSIFSKGRGFYLDYVPRHELAEAEEASA